MCSGPTINGGSMSGGGSFQDAGGKPVALKNPTSGAPGTLSRMLDTGNQSNPFLLSQTLSRLMIPKTPGTSVGDLKSPNPFLPPQGLVPKIGS